MTPQRLHAAAPFAILGGLAIVAGGGVAAASAHAPSQPLVWMVAYLVLVVGVAQMVFGTGQAWLAEVAPARATIWTQWWVLNLGNAGVIGGTLWRRPGLVTLGTLLFVAAIGWFLVATGHSRHRRWGLAYRVLLGLLLASACIGVALSFKHPA